MKKALLPITVILSAAVLLLWQVFFTDINFYLVAVLLLILSMLPFFASFERKEISAREMTLMATLIALAVVSRAAFYLLPQVKPIAAVVIVSAVCLGAERGYIIGAFSAFLSNFLFGQGHYTPFQMAALGLIGLAAGLIFKAVKVNRWTLALAGFVLASVCYGVIVDLSTILITYGSRITPAGVLSVYAAGTPFSLIFGFSTAVFLFLFGEPFIRKIERINTKFGLIAQ